MRGMALTPVVGLASQRWVPARVPQTRTRGSKRLYDEASNACHGEQGDGGHGGWPTLVGGLPVEAILAVAQSGRNNMPAFGRAYGEADLRDVAAYITEVLAK